MESYEVFLISGIAFLILSLIFWFISGVVEKKEPNKSQEYVKVGGFLFAISLLALIFSALFRFAL